MSKRKLHPRYRNWMIFEVRDGETIRGIFVRPHASPLEIALAHQENEDWLASRKAARSTPPFKPDAIAEELELSNTFIPDFI